MISGQARQLGYPLRFEKTDVDSLINSFETIKDHLRVHGVVCLKNISLEIEDYMKFARTLGELVVLPPSLSFNNKDPKYPPLTRVGNILIDGSLKDSSREAIVWHQDGNFWDPSDSYIFNFLKAEVLPTNGGDTWFIDIHKTTQNYKEQFPENFEKLKKCTVKVEVSKIPDFIPLLKQGMTYRTSYHDLVHTHPFNGEQLLFLSNPNHEIVEPESPITLQELIQFGVDQGIYVHKWEEGDLLIWDNVQVMHRSAGGFEGKRLLFRLQARMKFDDRRVHDIFEEGLHQKMLGQAIKCACDNIENGGGPFGAIIVNEEGEIIAESGNSVTSTLDPTAHAEVNAIRKACQALGKFQLDNCVLYSSCEPCAMCMGAVYWSRLSKVYYAAKRSDAALANFDDHFIYEEFNVEPEKRKIPGYHLDVKDSVAPFEKWVQKSDKIHY